MHVRDVPPGEPLPDDLTLADEDVHVWRASLDLHGPAVERLARTLSDDERARAERFRFERDRQRFVAGRGILRAILAGYLARPASRIRLRYGPLGKPALALEAGAPDLRFNVSHADGLALYAVARGREIGVDVERVVPSLVTAEMIARCLTGRESGTLRALEPGARPAAFFRCWTRREAYLKARGHGLAFSDPRENPSPLPAIVGDPAEAPRWSLRDLFPGGDYVGALVVARTPAPLPALDIQTA
jgi:4'-phosphopantetheinyl transferase